MFNIGYLKASPTTYVLHYAGGKVRREGPGLSFFYYVPSSTIVCVPFGSADAPFMFEQITGDFQQITIQGQITYRVADARRLAAMLDFSVTPSRRYFSDDPQKVGERLVRNAQTLARAETQKLDLKEALVRTEEISSALLHHLRSSDEIAQLGLEVLNVVIVAIRPTPEMARALEAGAREALQMKSDEAIYVRRNASVEQERGIKESELNTEIAVAEKQRKIRETKMAADIAIEKQRAALTDQKGENDRKDADNRAYALEATIKPLREMDWRTLMMLQGGTDNAGTVIAMAFQELAANAQKIQELNISPDLLKSLLTSAKR